MKLKKFRKNGKQKGIAIVCAVALLLTVAGVNLYRTFALYKEEKTFNVLRGVVPDFSKNRETPYNEQLNGADPVLDSAGTLIPVIVDPNTGVVKKADPEKEWYNYEKKQWANAIIPTDSAKSIVKSYSAGTTINESYIQSYFVWIPKYSYQIQTLYESSQGKEKAFDIMFGTENTDDNNDNECTTPMLENGVQGASGESGHCKLGNYMTHPAFLAFGGNGLWVGKFETGHSGGTLTSSTRKETYSQSDLTDIVVKPNQYAWTYTNVSTMYQLGYNYKTTLKSHMMKNTEWGAVAYLTQSIYGRCTKSEDGNTTCEEITINNNANYVTGYAGGSISGSSIAANPQKDAEDTSKSTYNYNNPKSVKASTTGNYTGIYDMSGGAQEYVMGVMEDGYGSAPLYSESGFKSSTLAKSYEYYDIYKFRQSDERTTNKWRILGDATSETEDWYGDYRTFVNASYTLNQMETWFMRGGDCKYGAADGIFGFLAWKGSSVDPYGFRLVLAPSK